MMQCKSVCSCEKIDDRQPMPGCGLGVTLTRSVRAVTGTGGTCPSLFVLLYSVSARCALGLAHTLHLWHLPVLESNGNRHTSLSLPARGLNAAGRSSRVTPRYVGRVLEIRKISEQAIALGRARTRKAQQTVVSNPLLADCESTPLRSDERGYSALVLQEDARDR